MNFVRLETSDGEIRWVNLEQVRRVTLTEESPGEPLLVVIFEEGDAQANLRIHGSDDTNRQVIKRIVTTLDELAE